MECGKHTRCKNYNGITCPYDLSPHPNYLCYLSRRKSYYSCDGDTITTHNKTRKFEFDPSSISKIHK